MVSDNNISNSSSFYLTQAGYYCHEKYEMYLPFLDQAQFWIEGICLTIIAIIGLLGKYVTLDAYIFRLLGHVKNVQKKLDIIFSILFQFYFNGNAMATQFHTMYFI